MKTTDAAASVASKDATAQHSGISQNHARSFQVSSFCGRCLVSWCQNSYSRSIVTAHEGRFPSQRLHIKRLQITSSSKKFSQNIPNEISYKMYILIFFRNAKIKMNDMAPFCNLFIERPFVYYLSIMSTIVTLKENTRMEFM